MKTRVPNFIRYLSALAACILVVLVSSCSSNSPAPLETHYYLLHSQHVVKASVSIHKTVTVKVLELPAYLHQPHLVMQLNKHQLHYARFDMWAEPLQTGFTKALINDLNQNNNNIQFVTEELQPGEKNENTLRVRVDYFHPSTASKVILSGVFWLENNVDNRLVEQPFSFELLLNEDGYTHAISQMRQLVTMMSASVLSSSF
ncbi:MAG: putative lipoprotein YmbA [Alteromonadaceae bacterium]|jgi:uncharacterized lipoprotein YmbA